MTDLHRNLIAGEWIESEDATDDINPSNTDEVVGRYARGSKADAEQAIAAAKAAFPAWSRSGVQQRYEILKKASDEILARKDELGRLLSREEGKTLAEGIGETIRAGQIFAFFAGEALRLAGELVPSVRPGVEVMIEREPAGVVGLITPWNFPIAIPGVEARAGARLRQHGGDEAGGPGAGLRLGARRYLESRRPAEGRLNLVMGRGSVVGQAILDSPDVNAISFTGSVETGRRVAKASAEHLRRFQLEMGGKNPLVVLDDADLKTAVECAANGAFFSTGQRCTASSRLVVTQGIHDRFVDALVERMKGLNVDDAVKEGTHIGPVVDATQLKQDQDYIEIGRKEGAKLAWGGERLNRATPGFYLQPALLTETTNAMRVNREEIFGPIATVVRVKDYDEALAVANDTPFGLSSGICTASLKHATHFRKNSEAGMVMVNLPTAGVDYHVPFGGRKGSSYGTREQGRYAVEFYTIVKTTYQLPV